MIAEQPSPPPSGQRRTPLPQRRPQGHLLPRLREEPGPEQADTDLVAEDIDLGSAEEVHSRMSAFQRGSSEGREAGRGFDQ